MSDNTPIKDPDNFNVAIPLNFYKQRVMDVTEKTAQQSGNKMFALKSEIIPKKEGVPTMIAGQCVDGVQFFHNVVVTPKAIRFVNECRSALGLPPVTEDTIDSMTKDEFLGQEGFAKCHCKKEAECDAEGNQLLDPYTNDPVFKYKRELLNWVPRPSK